MLRRCYRLVSDSSVCSVAPRVATILDLASHECAGMKHVFHFYGWGFKIQTPEIFKWSWVCLSYWLSMYVCMYILDKSYWWLYVCCFFFFLLSFSLIFLIAYIVQISPLLLPDASWTVTTFEPLYRCGVHKYLHNRGWNCSFVYFYFCRYFFHSSILPCIDIYPTIDTWGFLSEFGRWAHGYSYGAACHMPSLEWLE